MWTRGGRARAARGAPGSAGQAARPRPAAARGDAPRPGTHLSAGVGSRRPLPGPGARLMKPAARLRPRMARRAEPGGRARHPGCGLAGWLRGGRGRSLLPPAGRAGAHPGPAPPGLPAGSWAGRSAGGTPGPCGRRRGGEGALPERSSAPSVRGSEASATAGKQARPRVLGRGCEARTGCSRTKGRARGVTPSSASDPPGVVWSWAGGCSSPSGVEGGGWASGREVGGSSCLLTWVPASPFLPLVRDSPAAMGHHLASSEKVSAAREWVLSGGFPARPSVPRRAPGTE